MQSKKLSFKNDRYTYYESLLRISLLQRSCITYEILLKHTEFMQLKMPSRHFPAQS